MAPRGGGRIGPSRRRRPGINWPANCRLANRCSSEYNVLKSTSLRPVQPGNLLLPRSTSASEDAFGRLQYRPRLAPTATNRRFEMLLMGKSRIGGKRRHLRLGLIQNADSMRPAVNAGGECGSAAQIWPNSMPSTIKFAHKNVVKRLQTRMPFLSHPASSSCLETCC